MKLKEECGIFGGYSSENVIPIVKKGLILLQHRGQDSAGIAFGDNSNTIIKANGLVLEALTEEKLSGYTSNLAIGHVRYATSGGQNIDDAQPMSLTVENYDIAISFNGNIIEKERELCQKFLTCVEFLTNTDTELILKVIKKTVIVDKIEPNFENIAKILVKFFPKSAWSLLIKANDKIFGYRDINGYKPMMIGKTINGVFVSSEDWGFTQLGIEETTEIQAGQGVEISSNGFEIKDFYDITQKKQCVFEHIYFANPASNIFGKNVYQSRIELGKLCAKVKQIDADIVVPVMDSGFWSSLGYAEESKIPLQLGIIKNQDSLRSFIQPTADLRSDAIYDKHTIINSVVKDKRVILLDDSVVRGTTSKILITMLKNAGAKEVHLVLTSPMIVNTCHWGVDIPTKQELICNKFENTKLLANELNADSVTFLMIEDLKSIFNKNEWCYNCFNDIS